MRASKKMETHIETENAVQNELMETIKNQSTMIQALSQKSTSSGFPSAATGVTQRVIGILTENQTSRLLGYSGLKWTPQHMLSPL